MDKELYWVKKNRSLCYINDPNCLIFTMNQSLMGNHVHLASIRLTVFLKLATWSSELFSQELQPVIMHCPFLAGNLYRPSLLLQFVSEINEFELSIDTFTLKWRVRVNICINPS